MAKVKIVAVGECMIDHYQNLNRSFVGGISLNFAVNAKHCGAEAVSLVSCVGADKGGRRVLEKLAREGIDASHVAVLPGETARIDIQVLAQGERLFPPGGFHRNVLLDLRLSESDLSFIRQHEVLAFLYDRSQWESPANRALEALDFDGQRVADFGDWADYAGDYDLLVSALEPLALAFICGNQATIDFLLPLSRRFDGLIVVTCGAAGSVALVDGAPLFQPAQVVPNPVDSTGCGDAFQAAFTVAYFLTGDIEQALRAATARAAAVLQHHGAT